MPAVSSAPAFSAGGPRSPSRSSECSWTLTGTSRSSELSGPDHALALAFLALELWRRLRVGAAALIGLNRGVVARPKRCRPRRHSAYARALTLYLYESEVVPGDQASWDSAAGAQIDVRHAAEIRRSNPIWRRSSPWCYQPRMGHRPTLRSSAGAVRRRSAAWRRL
jgi:hypothetical protein